MAYKFGPNGVLEPGDYFSSTCMWCDKECERVEILWTGEGVEAWCYCKYCDAETWHPIFNKETNPEEKNNSEEEDSTKK